MDLQRSNTGEMNESMIKGHLIFLEEREVTGAGLKQALSQATGNIQVDILPDAESLKTALRISQPEFILLHINNSGRCAFGLADEINEQYPEVKVAFWGNNYNSLKLERGLRVNVKGYFHEGDSVEEISRGLREIENGRNHFSTALEKYVSHLNAPSLSNTTTRTDILGLTNRQLEVLVYLAKGCSVKEAAKIMHISDKSVDSHKYRIMHRLNIHDRVELALFAIKEGLIDV